MTSSWQKSDDVTNSTTIKLNEADQDTLIEECASLKKQCDELTMQKQAIVAESQRIIEEKDNELKRLQEMTNTVLPNNNETNDEMFTLKKTREYDEQIHTLQLRIKELEDWSGDYSENESLEKNKEQSNIDLLTSRNRQLENDLQRLQSQQRNNQSALERLDEFEETISQLQEELDHLRSNEKRQQTGNNEDTKRLLVEERKRSEHLLEESRLQLKNEKEQSEEKLLQVEREKTILQDQLQNKDKQIEIERNQQENLQKQIKQFKDEQIEEQENRVKEINIREILERQLVELNEEVQSLGNDKNELNNQLDELRQQLQSRDRQLQTIQTSAATPGAPPINLSVSDTRDLPQTSERLLELEAQIFQTEQQHRQIYSVYEQFNTLLPREFSSSDNIHMSIADRFVDLFEQFSAYCGTFSIVQEELDSLKQILHEKQDELEKLRSHLELTQLQGEQSLSQKDKAYESDEDELEEIFGFQRASSRQSLASITPGEKQQLLAQNELLSSLLTEKEQELILLQQAEKTREDLIRTVGVLRLNIQQMQFDKEAKQIELNDIRNVLDEKLRENSSLKKEKMYFIEKLAEVERERQEQQSINQISPKQFSPDREKSPTLTTAPQQNTERIATQEQYLKLRTDYNELLELSNRQHDESLWYYNEHTRLLSLFNDLNTKHSQLQIDHESIHSLIEQKTQAYLQCQNELNTYQNLLYHQKKKSDDIDYLRSSLNERDLQLQKLIDNEKQLLTKQSEFEHNIKLYEETNFKLKSNQQLFEQIQLDLKRITHERDLAVVEKKQLEIEIKRNEEQISIITRLTNENNEIRQRLEEYNQVLSSINLLQDEIKTKELFINKLQAEIENFQIINTTRVEKQLVKNILLSYLQTPTDKQQEVIPLLGALVEFTQEEYQKAISATSNNNTNTSWLTGWLGASSSKTEPPVYHPDKSFAELFIQYIDQQSTNTLQQETISNLDTDNSTHKQLTPVVPTALNIEQNV